MRPFHALRAAAACIPYARTAAPRGNSAPPFRLTVVAPASNPGGRPTSAACGLHVCDALFSVLHDPLHAPSPLFSTTRAHPYPAAPACALSGRLVIDRRL